MQYQVRSRLIWAFESAPSGCDECGIKCSNYRQERLICRIFWQKLFGPYAAGFVGHARVQGADSNLTRRFFENRSAKSNGVDRGDIIEFSSAPYRLLYDDADLATLIDGLSENSVVLDVGCGEGSVIDPPSPFGL